MDLRQFPFDIQHCEMNFTSLKYPISKVNFTQVAVCNFNKLYNSISETSAYKIISINGSIITKQWMEDNYALFHVLIIFQRQFSFYLYQVVCLL